MACKWIIGSGAFLDIAYEAWQRAFPELTLEKLSIAQNSKYEFDLSPLYGLNPSDGSAFVAFNEHFGNFKRMELMSAVMQKGFKLDSLVSPHAMVASNVEIGANTLIGDGVIIGYGSRIGYNSIILPGVQIGSKTHIRPSCWLESGTIIGSNVEIGTHCIIRSGAIISSNVQVGRHCELGWTKRYEKDIAPKTIFDPRYDSPIFTYGI